MEPAIRAEGLSKRYGEVDALKDLDLEVAPVRSWAISAGVLLDMDGAYAPVQVHCAASGAVQAIASLRTLAASVTNPALLQRVGTGSPVAWTSCQARAPGRVRAGRVS